MGGYFFLPLCTCKNRPQMPMMTRQSCNTPDATGRELYRLSPSRFFNSAFPARDSRHS